MPPHLQRVSVTLVAICLTCILYIVVYFSYKADYPDTSLHIDTKTIMASLKLKCLVVPPKMKHTATVIFLHVRSRSTACP